MIMYVYVCTKQCSLYLNLNFFQTYRVWDLRCPNEEEEKVNDTVTTIHTLSIQISTIWCFLKLAVRETPRSPTKQHQQHVQQQ